MRRGPASGCASMRGTQALVALPITLACFALVLQLSSRSPSAQPVALPGLADGLGMHSERARFMQMPERALTRAGDGLAHLLGGERDYVAHNQKVPQDWSALADVQPEALNMAQGELPKLAFMTTTSDSFRQIQLWTQYHRALGVELFYLFVDGQAARADVIEQLQQLPGVRTIPKTPELRWRQEHSRIWNETWLSAFFHKPCNHELFVQQSLNMEEGIKLARREGADWVLHIDTDELMYPGGAPHYSLQAVLADVPASVDTVVFPNYESMPERDDITDPFTEVTLFKRNFHHVVSDAYFRSYKAVTRGNPNYFITYGNGKSAARVQPGLRPNGAHRWFNYAKQPREVTHDTAAVLHFTFNRFADLKARRDRCDCAPTEADAKRCFILPFDRMAFLAASLKSDEELLDWFRQRLVWNDPAVVKDLVKNGLFYRIYTPQVLIRGFISANERAAAAAVGPDPGKQLADGGGALGRGSVAGAALAQQADQGSGAAKQRRWKGAARAPGYGFGDSGAALSSGAGGGEAAFQKQLGVELDHLAGGGSSPDAGEVAGSSKSSGGDDGTQAAARRPAASAAAETAAIIDALSDRVARSGDGSGGGGAVSEGGGLLGKPLAAATIDPLSVVSDSSGSGGSSRGSGGADELASAAAGGDPPQSLPTATQSAALELADDLQTGGVAVPDDVAARALQGPGSRAASGGSATGGSAAGGALDVASDGSAKSGSQLDSAALIAASGSAAAGQVAPLGAALPVLET